MGAKSCRVHLFIRKRGLMVLSIKHLSGHNFRRVRDKENYMAQGYSAASEKWDLGLKDMEILTPRIAGILRRP